MKKARLGKGLDALLGEVDPKAESANVKENLRHLPVDQLQRGPFQPRRHMDEQALNELAESIKVQGIVQPILVRETKKDGFQIIAGERRWRAAQLAGLETVPAVVRDIPDQAAMAVGLIENIQREDLNAVEQAQGLQRLLDEFGLTHQQIADAIGRSRAAVSNQLRLLDLHPTVREYLEQNRIDMGHARALLSLPRESQAAAAQRVMAKGLSVRQTEILVKNWGVGAKGKKRGPSARDSDITRLEEDLSGKLGARVAIAHRRDGNGKITVHYTSLEELDGILERIH